MKTFLAPDIHPLDLQLLDLRQVSRREFLRCIKTGGLALFLLPFQQRGLGREKLIPLTSLSDSGPFQSGAPVMGRVLNNDLRVYDRPSYQGQLLNVYWRDLVFPITAATIGDRLPEHNRVWYLINNEGYVHSGMVQPVEMIHNQPLDSLPPGGRLAEVSVPYTDARRDPNRSDWISYRLYYGTTHWIRSLVADKAGSWWYRISDDKYRKEYYVDARHMRPLDEAALASFSVKEGAEKRLEVRLADQLVIAYEDGQPVFMTRVASGARFIEGNYSTPAGRYVTNRKRPSRHMAAGDLASPSGYDLPGVPWVSYLTLTGISFHGTYWHNDFGIPRSHGCLNVSISAASWIYRWTLPGVPYGDETFTGKAGTPVDIVE